MSVLSKEDWPLVRETLYRALELPAGERDEFVRHRTASKEGLAEVVLQLLAIATAGQNDPVPIGVVVPDLVGKALSRAQSIQPAAGDRVGSYRLIRRIGEGGMGSVFLAERADEDFEQKVAVKFVRDSAKGQSIGNRFRLEERILAGLIHPGIARLYDGHVTESGLPYFVMEYVDGTPITRYCTENDLSVDARLALFVQVCEAVSYAQQHLVVHRDLKPSNILVGGDGLVKLLDFGIAKVLDSESKDRTQTQTRLMTPTYAAPEQLTGDKITTATDVFSLGVVLYEMLTGQLPYSRTGSFAAIVKAVCEEVPRAPSLTARSETLGADEGSVARRLKSRLRRDVDAIVLKALRKDPGQRYASAAELAMDIERYRSGFPTSARRGSKAYRIGRFVRRHRLGSIMTVVIVFLTAAFVWRLASERAAKEREAQTAQSVTTFLQGLFETAAAPTMPEGSGGDWFGRLRGDSTTVGDLLTIGRHRVYTELDSDPHLQARLLETFGQIFGTLNQPGLADTLLTDAYERSVTTLGRDHPRSVSVALRLVNLYSTQMRQPQRADSLFETIATQVQSAKLDDDLRVRALTNQSYIKSDLGDIDGALEVLDAARRIADRADDSRLQLSVNRFLQSVLQRAGRWEELEDASRKRLALLDKSSAMEIEYVIAHLNLANALGQLGEWNEADSIGRKGIIGSKEHYGDSSRITAAALAQYAGLLRKQHRLSEADSLYREALSVQETALGVGHPSVASILNNAALNRHDAGDFDGALEYLSRTLEIDLQVYPRESRPVAFSLINIAAVELDKGELGMARSHSEEGLDIFEQVGYVRTGAFIGRHGNMVRLLGDPVTADSLFGKALGRLFSHDVVDSTQVGVVYSYSTDALLDQGRVSDADSAATKAIRFLGGRTGRAAAMAYRALANVRFAQERFDESLVLAERSEDSYREVYQRSPGLSGELAVSQCVRARAILAKDDPRSAEQLLREALSVISLERGEEHYLAAWTRSLLGESLLHQDRYEEAKDLLVEAYQSLVLATSRNTLESRRAGARLESFYKISGRQMPRAIRTMLRE